MNSIMKYKIQMFFPQQNIKFAIKKVMFRVFKDVLNSVVVVSF
jgi:hypothetical protein